MCSSQSEAELASPPPRVRRRRKIVDSDYVFVGQGEEIDEGDLDESSDVIKKSNEADTEFVPDEAEDDTEFVPEVVKPKKRGRPRKSENKPVKLGAAKAKKSLGNELLSAGLDKPSSVSDTGSVGEIINLADADDDDDKADEESFNSQKVDTNGNYEFPATATTPGKMTSGYKLSQPAKLPPAGTPRPGQPRMLRPPRPGRGRGRARPAGQAWPRPGSGARRSLEFPGLRLSNPRSMAPMMRNATHPKPSYFPVITPPPPPQPEQSLSPSHSAITKLTSLGVSVARERAPPTSQGWVLPPGITVTRTPPLSETGQGPVMSISTLATSLHQLGQVEGKRRLVQYRLTEEQIRALSTLGLGQEEPEAW